MTDDFKDDPAVEDVEDDPEPDEQGAGPDVKNDEVKEENW